MQIPYLLRLISVNLINIGVIHWFTAWTHQDLINAPGKRYLDGNYIPRCGIWIRSLIT